MEQQDWTYEVIQKRYQLHYGLALTTAQAQQVAAFEQQRDLYSPHHHFSFWEQQDFERFYLQPILSSGEWETFLTRQQEEAALQETSLQQIDIDYLPQLETARKTVAYYRSTLLPALRKERITLSVAFSAEQEKVTYLRSMYQRYLNETKKAILVNHFRHSRTFQPNLLELSLLLHEQQQLLPHFESFKAHMDAPTLALAQYLSQRMAHLLPSIAPAFRAALTELQTFITQLHAPPAGEVKGWHTTLPAEAPDNGEKYMFALLIEG